MIRRLLTASAITACLALPAIAAERAIIVLDASGSMWGQIDGKAKIEIARKTLGQVLGGLPSDLELGLIAYGHRKKGQCSDIELMVPAGAGTAGAITDAVNGIKPKGKTPLSDSVLQAAESLKYTEDKATVILVTDGLETCDADPCALGRTLEESGVDFTAHVVGFGLSKEDGKQVSCLAEETGGVYISAGNEEELVQALNETVAAPVEPPAPKASLTAPDSAEIAATITIGWDGPGHKNDTIQFFDANSGPDGKVLHSQQVQWGDYDNRSVQLPVAAKPGTYQLRYWDHEGREIIATRDIEIVDAEVSLTPDEPVSIGTEFGVAWVGPGDDNDEIYLFDPNSGPDGKVLHSQRLIWGDYDNRRVKLSAPATEGTYILQYWNADNRTVLATREVQVQGVPITLTPEEPISVGKEFNVAWEGPGDDNDEIYLFDPNSGPDGKSVHSQRLIWGDFENKTVKISGPGKPGTYELRYWSGDNRKDLASVTVEVVDTVVTITPEEPISVGKQFNVIWEGPGDDNDEVYLFDPNAGTDGKTVHSQRLIWGDFENKTVTISGPGKPGTYELRYWSGDNRKDLASVTVEVVDTVVTITPEEPISVGKQFNVIWEGPGDDNDEVYLFDPNAGTDGKTVHSQRLIWGDFENKTVTISGPGEPGAYELRYWSGDNRKDLASVTVEVVDAVVSMTVDGPISVGKAFTVAWEGPGDNNDEIYLFDPNKGPDGKTVQSKRLVHGDYDNKNVTLPGPAKAGPYELRYWSGDNRKDLAIMSVEVEDTPVSLEAAENVEAAAKLVVTWEGPGARYDDIQVWDPTARNGDGKVVTSKRLVQDDYDNRKVTMPAPAKPGAYELRYWNGQNRTVLATRPVNIIAASVVLVAPAQIGQALTLTVNWQGPGARYDDVQIWNPRTEKVVRAVRLTKGDYDAKSLKIAAPAKPGSYELRYWNGQNRAVMASNPLEVTEIPVSITGPEVVEVETKFGVIWEGPGARYDEIRTIDAATGKRISAQRLTRGDYANRTLTITAPKETGEYKLQYYNGENKAVLAEVPLSVN
ncbi:MAG: VWA domain-containing protein [Pseudomonadota bacterium]